MHRLVDNYSEEDFSQYQLWQLIPLNDFNLRKSEKIQKNYGT